MTAAPAGQGGGEPDARVIAASLTVPERFGEIYNRHAPAIGRYLSRRVGRPAADDLAAETFLVAFRLRGRYDPAWPDARPWLYGIASNLLRRHHRTERAYYRALATTGADPVADADHAEDVVLRVAAVAEVRAVAGALARLTVRERDVLLLYAWAGLGYDEISAALQIPVGTVRSRLNRARGRLRHAIGTTAGEEDERP